VPREPTSQPGLPISFRVIVPPELLQGLDELRIFGNDAAHWDAKIYDEIGAEEVEVVIEFAKEVLKAVYQSAALLGRLQALKQAQSEESS
jgi:hypothetical protein